MGGGIRRTNKLGWNYPYKETFQIDLQFLISKHRIAADEEKIYVDKNGKSIHEQIADTKETMASLPLQDYVEIGVFDKTGKELYLKKHKVNKINNQLNITLNQHPIKVVIDPYFKLLERNIEDN